MMTKPPQLNRHLIQDQFSILLADGRNVEGRAHSIQSLAKAVELSDQALLNLLNGRTISPRLETARAICQLYGITLDYFGLDSVAACQRYLLRAQQQTSPTLLAIDEQSRQLSPTTLESLARIVAWIWARDQQRKSIPLSP
jgi:transcriptional regulator with XRE-family HTH domain